MSEDKEKNLFVQEKFFDVKEILFVMISRISLFIVLAILGFVIATVGTKLFIPKTYSSSVSLYVKNYTQGMSSKDDEEGISGNDLTASKKLAETYIAILSDKSILKQVGEELIKDNGSEKMSEYFEIKIDDAGSYFIDAAKIKKLLSFSIISETELVSVVAVTTDPWLSAELCRIVAEIAPDLLIRVVGAGSVEAVGVPEIPEKAIGPNTKLNALIGAGLGLALAFVIILLQYLFDDTINSSDTVSMKYNLPLLGEIPVFNEEEEKKKKKSNKKGEVEKIDKRQLILDFKPNFVLTEAYNTFRTNLLFSMSASENNILVVSSAEPGEGKSVTSANITISMGETDTKVLLIDADMRKPVQHKLFHLKNKKGLSTLISGMSKIEDTINYKVSGNLDVITAGPIPPNPSQLLESEKLENLLSELSKIYDYIVIDTPPINVVADSLIIADKAAGIMLVAKQGETTFSQVERVLMSAYTTQRNILGIVLNAAGNFGGVYGKKYSYKYGYKYYKNYSSYEENENNDK